MTQESPTVAAENGAERTRSGIHFRPLVDIVETADELLVVADLPGANPGEIDVHFEDGSLHLHAPAAQRRPEAAGLLLEEYGVGDFYRTFRVSEQIDVPRISAEYRDGVLRLHLPKVEAVRPRKIQVATT